MNVAYAALEEQLEALGQRWADVCKWVEDHWALLQELLTKWQQFGEEYRQFSDWLTEKETILNGASELDTLDTTDVVSQIKDLKVGTVFKCLLYVYYTLIEIWICVTVTLFTYIHIMQHLKLILIEGPVHVKAFFFVIFQDL